MEFISSKIKPGVIFTSCRDSKFKTQVFSISLLTSLERDTVSMNAILPRVLYRGNKIHGNMKEILQKTEALYGTHITPVVRKKGEVLLLGFYCDCICSDYTFNHIDPLSSVIEMTSDLLLSPETSGGQLIKEYVDSEKMKLREDIEARETDKDSYAYYRAIKEMCSYERYAYDEMGTAEGLDTFDHYELTKHYRELLSQCPIEIFYCGPLNHEEVAQEIKYSLSPLPREDINYEIYTDVRMNSLEEHTRQVIDYYPAAQTRVIIGYRIGEYMQSADIPAIVLFNSLLGGGANSLLFKLLRKENGLCYDVTSSVDCIKGILTIQTGIEYDNKDKAIALIESAIDDIAKGRINSQEFESAIQSTHQNIELVSDDASLLEDFYLTSLFEEMEYTPDEMAGACHQITKLQLSDIATSLQQDLIYILAPEEQER